MASELPHFKIRLPTELKGQLDNAARRNGRSVTAEIVSRLEGSFESLEHVMLDNRLKEKELLHRDMESLLQRHEAMMDEGASHAELDAVAGALERLRARRVLIENDIAELLETKAGATQPPKAKAGGKSARAAKKRR